LQLTFNKKRPAPAATLAGLARGEHGILEAFDLPEDLARRLMELGLLPGVEVRAARGAPGGDPRVYHVDGASIALRRETADRVRLRRP